MAFDRDQRFNRCCRRAPSGEEGEVAVGDATPDQQAACPQAVICIVEWLALEIGQFEITPIMQPQFLGSGSCRKEVGRAPRPGDVSCRAGDPWPLASGLKHMSAADPEHVAFARPA